MCLSFVARENVLEIELYVVVGLACLSNSFVCSCLTQRVVAFLHIVLSYKRGQQQKSHTRGKIHKLSYMRKDEDLNASKMH